MYFLKNCIESEIFVLRQSLHVFIEILNQKKPLSNQFSSIKA